jgi:hypothetical protein
MTRPSRDVAEVRRLVEEGRTLSDVARITGIPRPTIRNWRDLGFGEAIARHERALPDPATCTCRAGLLAPAYAHFLGLYLGDGGLVPNPKNALRLTISCDAKYPRLIAEAEQVVREILPVNVWRRTRAGCVDVCANSLHWRCVLPQHGPGAKHLRVIALEPWQVSLIEQAPGRLIRGLVNSDGCRAINRVKKYEYVRYQFSNRSRDIREIFRWACGLVGAECRQSNQWTISVSKRASVEILEGLVGPKD